MVGTVKMNKPETAALLINGKNSLFLHLSCTSYLTPSTYVPARNKNVILFSQQHHDDMRMGESQGNKLEIMVHYNDN